MKPYAALAILLLAGCSTRGLAEQVGSGLPAVPRASADMLARDEAGIGAVSDDRFHTTYVRLGSRSAEGLLYDPSIGAVSDTALVYLHPNGNTFDEPLGPQMASRGYRTLMINHHGTEEADDIFAPSISQGIRFLKSLEGVDRVVLVAHSGGGHVAAFYQNVAENGPSACSGPEKIYPCRIGLVIDLEKADGLVLLDPTLGAFHQMSSIDPAWTEAGRDPALDMFAPGNGYDPSTGTATYSPEMIQRFHAAQANRNAVIVDGALSRLAAIERGEGAYSDDEPLVIKGMAVSSGGARLYQPDTALVSRTRAPHLLLKADGADVDEIISSVRPATGQRPSDRLPALATSQNTTVRRFLAASAVRTGADFAITENNIVGVDWPSAMSSSPSNAAGVTVPSLVLTMSCHYLAVPGEIIFDSLSASDKTYAAVEGATHLFAPCRPEYGDTMKRTFDFLDGWLSMRGRF